MKRLRKPDLLDDEFEDLLKHSAEEESVITSKDSIPAKGLSGLSTHQQNLPTWELAESGNILSISNMTAPEAGSNASTQLSSIMARLISLLQSYKCESSNVIFSTLLLRSMSDFTTINPIYGAHFTKPIPPSRVTVACGSSLPEGIEVVLSVTVSKSNARRGLHVQSRSYWAPANIGPYSQAVTVPINNLLKEAQDRPIWDSPQIVYVAGQIPLVPASMEIVKADTEQTTPGELEGFKTQTVLALQHLWRIGRVMNVGWWTGGVAFISHCSSDEGSKRAKLAAEAWRAIHLKLKPNLNSEDEDAEEQGNDVDVWHTKHGGFSGSEGVETDQRPALPDYDRVNGGGEGAIPPCFTAQVQELPRAADIEWTSVGLAKASVSVMNTTGTPSIHVTGVLDTSSSFVFVGIEDVKDLLGLEKAIREAHEWESVSWTLQTYDDTPQAAFDDLIGSFPDGGPGSQPLQGDKGDHFYVTKMTRALAAEVAKNPIVKYMAENDREDGSDARGHIYSEDDPEKIQRLSASVENQYVVYTSQALPTEWLEDIEIKKQIIPCQRVWDENGHELAAVVVVRRNTEDLRD
ncbi:uncharacterized protein BDZ99DRAFT_463000 [Mytilinidion resinicola]|uniref:Uncharacterized protein n=1 Tax=Mytilinidion resinicola TaxID=574789 RepID=A0A6A6YR39_9PEZI|nr:uncharacterized protein BDZ99DRAFT_463000 [Mytilinidion resinicola]KAF2810425.1 hypothetical protein BDZ99DRAFT_463000 [Mytilinidion resinicola]